MDAGEKVQRLRVLAALLRILVWFPVTMCGDAKLPITPDPGDLMPSSGILGHLNTCSAHT